MSSRLADVHGVAGHDPHLAHHFESRQQQLQAVTLGMWIFLATEILFFGGLFCAYAVYRSNHPEIFVWAHRFLDIDLGALNTVILIVSSFTMAWSVRAAQLRQRSILQLMLALTLLCATGFLGVKAVEYHGKWEHGLLWARQYRPTHAKPAGEAAPAPIAQDPAPDPDRGAGDASAVSASAVGPTGLASSDLPASDTPAEVAPRNAQVFFSIYFLMTGLHGLHVLGGMGAMVWLLVKAGRGHFDGGHYTPVHAVGLYWHLVDLIWIYLFLLLYLIH